jgi:hypothetical protein
MPWPADVPASGAGADLPGADALTYASALELGNRREDVKLLRIPAKLIADSGHREHGFRSSRSLIGATRREQLWV